MTNNEILQTKAVQLLNDGKLNSFEAQFVESIKNWSKKELNKISSKQYEVLRKIANKIPNN